jgi:formylglycine-generating enzyme required for sulfatase activity
MNHRLLAGQLALCAAATALGCGPTQKEVETGKVDAKPAATCPQGQVLKDTQCIPAPAASAPTCPDGQVAKDGGCVKAPLACAQGTHASPAGEACVPDEAPQAKVDPPAAQGPCAAGMALVKGGSYKMGYLKSEATVSDLCFDTTEATAKDYEGCVTAGKCNTNLLIACTETTTYKVAGKEDHPMVCIDFPQAVDYCTWQGKRLPTEEEWEWAARGGDKNNQYSWGNDAPADQACWAGKEGRTGTCPVKAHPASATPQGLLGMSGNVFEWATRKLDAKVTDRVGRGGSWRDGLPNVLRVDRPGSFSVTYRCGFLGVRCVSAPKK